ncbi:MAG TPA: hypothetical protein VFJ05_01625, partial [Nitrososphaeraceae archaeon]|nr:hypothetical protein [Nitrososphaeraceae archaeon]
TYHSKFIQSPTIEHLSCIKQQGNRFSTFFYVAAVVLLLLYIYRILWGDTPIFVFGKRRMRIFAIT